MNIGTERRGLGRGLGELFQRTEPRPAAASSQSITWRQRRSHQCPQVPTSPIFPWTPSRPILGNREPSSTKRR